MYDNSKQITKEYLLEKVGEVAIFMKYLNLYDIKEEELICNPLRADKNPTASFKWVNDRIQFRDWSETFSRDCFNVAQLVTRKKTFYDTLIQIAVDFNLVSGGAYSDFKPVNIDENLKEIRKEEREKVSIKVKTKEWHRIDKEFWSQFGITGTEIFNKFKVYSVAEAFIDGRSVYMWKKTDICFAFYFGNEDFKLYFPFRERQRFIHNNASILQGWEQLPEKGDHCLITKSYKDVIAFSLVDVIAVAPMSETVIISEAQYLELRNRFNKLFLLNDNDLPGRKATVRFIRDYPDVTPLLFPQGEPKDYTDNIKVYGINDMTEYVRDWKERLL